jgi:hypothetical protein
MISLLRECNKNRLKELENDTIKKIIEEFSNYQQVDEDESGEWGYEIVGITDGKYGGTNRSIIDNELSNNNSSLGDFINSDVKKNIEDNLTGQATINISNQRISGYDCSYVLGQECLWVNDNKDTTSIYGPGKFAKIVSISSPSKYGNCDVSDGQILIEGDKLLSTNINRVCRQNYKFDFEELSEGLCNKYYIVDNLRYGKNKDSKIYAKKINIGEGGYGGNSVDSRTNYFKARDHNNNKVDGQDYVNDGKIIRFRRCENSDIEDNPNLGIDDNAQNERKKSLKITFRRIWSNKVGDMTEGDNEKHSIYNDGETKWKVEIDDGNWEGLQIRDFDNLNFSLSLASGKKPLSYINNKYLRHSVKEKLKTSLDNFLTNNIDIKNLLNIDDIKLNTIKNNLYTDKNRDILPPQNCAYSTGTKTKNSGAYYVKGCGRRHRDVRYCKRKTVTVKKTKMRQYNGKHCTGKKIHGINFSASDINNLNLNKSKSKYTEWRDETRNCKHCGTCRTRIKTRKCP